MQGILKPPMLQPHSGGLATGGGWGIYSRCPGVQNGNPGLTVWRSDRDFYPEALSMRTAGRRVCRARIQRVVWNTVTNNDLPLALSLAVG